MNKLFLFFIVFALSSCGSGGVSTETVSGKWKLISYEEGDDNPFKKNLGVFEITDCDKASVWQFTNEDSDPLDDGTEVKVLKVKAAEDCNFYDFESKWAVKGNDLFLTATSLGGIGGRSYAGLFDIIELDELNMVIQISDATLTFKKLD